MADKYLPFEQDGVEYNLYDMPKGFVIKGDLVLSDKSLTELPDLSEVVVKGNFRCEYNKLTTLKGAPKEVKGDFQCHCNQLATLEGAPQKVVGSFLCHYNQLTTLEEAPQKVGEDFNSDNNQLTTLDGAPQKVGGGFSCYDNQLTTLKGAPQKVGDYFVCGKNKLTTLEGAPKEVGGSFDCEDNKELTSLFGVSALEENRRIYCDDALGEKYGFSDSENGGITFAELNESTLYKSEVAADKVRRKQAQERAEKQQKVTENTKAAFDAWLKNKGIEPPRR